MQAIDLAEKLVRHFEGCRLEAYQDSAGVWTIGYGHTHGVVPGQAMTQVEADAALSADLVDVARALAALRPDPPAWKWSCREAALLDFGFNLGQGALAQLLKHQDVQGQIELWVHAGGRVLPGLVKRRAVEAFLYELGDL